MIVLALDLGRPLGARGDGDRKHAGLFLHEAAGQRGLSGTRGRRQDEDEAATADQRLRILAHRITPRSEPARGIARLRPSIQARSATGTRHSPLRTGYSPRARIPAPGNRGDGRPVLPPAAIPAPIHMRAQPVELLADIRAGRDEDGLLMQARRVESGLPSTSSAICASRRARMASGWRAGDASASSTKREITSSCWPRTPDKRQAFLQPRGLQSLDQRPTPAFRGRCQRLVLSGSAASSSSSTTPRTARRPSREAGFTLSGSLQIAEGGQERLQRHPGSRAAWARRRLG